MNIKITGNDEIRETMAKDQLERLLREYDFEHLLICQDVTFASKTMPASHPTITLNTRYLEDDDTALSVFIHEELHWYLNTKSKEREKAIDELKKLYPDVPVGYPEGTKSENSTYEHLLLNALEFEELKKLIGEDRARKVIEKLDYYKWIYKTVLEDNEKLRQILEKNDLLLNNR